MRSLAHKRKMWVTVRPRTGSVARVAGRPFCTRANLRLGGALMQNGEPVMGELLPIITAVALTCATAPVSWAQSGEVHSAAMMQQRSAALAHSYLQTWSSNARAALEQVPKLYAPRVRFYGRVLDRNRLMREKATFLQRWPAFSSDGLFGAMRIGPARCRSAVMRALSAVWFDP